MYEMLEVETPEIGIAQLYLVIECYCAWAGDVRPTGCPVRRIWSLANLKHCCSQPPCTSFAFEFHQHCRRRFRTLCAKLNAMNRELLLLWLIPSIRRLSSSTIRAVRTRPGNDFLQAVLQIEEQPSSLDNWFARCDTFLGSS